MKVRLTIVVDAGLIECGNCGRLDRTDYWCDLFDRPIATEPSGDHLAFHRVDDCLQAEQDARKGGSVTTSSLSFRILGFLRSISFAARASEIAEAVDVSMSIARGELYRLEHRGRARRISAPGDRDSVWALTARGASGTMRAAVPRSGFAIVDRSTLRPYIDRAWPTRCQAEFELADLLKPYPTGDHWRARLVVAEDGEQIVPMARDRRRAA